MNSALTTYENDDKEIWRQFRRDLISRGYRSEQISQYADELETRLRELTVGEVQNPPHLRFVSTTGIVP
jgi:CRISPR/Cas system-associated protein endoribonuclease Cas2